ncbi:hypothetical protein [Streptomyces sp. IBSBF 2507]|uniref:hypothetical protein n=1 Tax=Streptomyces sp. IBSBF 2507 TaxID=2903530 RepID=UPI00351DE24C
MTYHHRDPDHDHLTITPTHTTHGTPALHITTTPAGVLLTLDHLEELVAGIRDTGRQAAAGPNPQHLGGKANAEDCPACWDTNPPYPFLCPGGTP